MAGLANTALTLASGHVEPWTLFTAFLFALMFAPMPMVFVAVPIFLLLARAKRITVWASLASGAVTGAVFALFLYMPNSAPVEATGRFAVIGALAALAFWFVWLKGQRASAMGSSGSNAA